MPRVRLQHPPNARAHGARPGRSATPRTRQMLIRLTEEEYTLLAEAADAADEALANWSRRQLLRAAARANPAPSDGSQ